VEEFLTGRAMPVSDLEFGPDGAMYLIVGGRGTQSGLYRVSYEGDEHDSAEDVSEEPAKLRRLRRSLEAFHGKQDAKAVETAWPHLGSNDRHIRYAARIAVESQPVGPGQDAAAQRPLRPVEPEGSWSSV